MDALIHAFNVAITYPILNLFFWLYAFTDNFLLAILCFSCLVAFCLLVPQQIIGFRHNTKLKASWPEMAEISARYRDDREAAKREMAALKQRAGLTGALNRLPWRLTLLQFYCGLGFY